jgi:hypothetical protein
VGRFTAVLSKPSLTAFGPEAEGFTVFFGWFSEATEGRAIGFGPSYRRMLMVALGLVRGG